MSRVDPELRKHQDESQTSWYRRLRGTFIVENLQFSPELSADQTEVREAYHTWMGRRNQDFCPPLIGEFYRSITGMGATLDEKDRMFYGVGFTE